jgi:hypothetical protein
MTTRLLSVASAQWCRGSVLGFDQVQYEHRELLRQHRDGSQPGGPTDAAKTAGPAAQVAHLGAAPRPPTAHRV